MCPRLFIVEGTIKYVTSMEDLIVKKTHGTQFYCYLGAQMASSKTTILPSASEKKKNILLP